MNRSMAQGVTLRMYFSENGQEHEPELLDVLLRDTVPLLTDLSRLKLLYSTKDRSERSTQYPGAGWRALMGKWINLGVDPMVVVGNPEHVASPDHNPYMIRFTGRTRLEPYRPKSCLWTGRYLELDILTGVDGWGIPNEIAASMVSSALYAAQNMRMFQASIRLRSWPLAHPLRGRSRSVERLFANAMDRIVDFGWLTIVHSDILDRYTEFGPIKERFELTEIPDDHVLIKLAPSISQVTEADLRDFASLVL